MKSNLPNNKVTLEDLLRVKRAERPSAEFWEQFESELRTKQLTAIIEKRSWWQALPSRAWVRWGLATVGTAAAAITVAILNFPAGAPADASMPTVAVQPVPTRVTLASPIVPEEAVSSAEFVAATVLPADLMMAQAAFDEPEVVAAAEPEIPSASRETVVLASAPTLVSLNLDKSLIPPPSQAPVLAPEFAMLGQSGRTTEDPLAAMPTPREKRNQTWLVLQEYEMRQASMSEPISDRASSGSYARMNLRPERTDVQTAVAGIGMKFGLF